MKFNTVHKNKLLMLAFQSSFLLQPRLNFNKKTHLKYLLVGPNHFISLINIIEFHQGWVDMMESFVHAMDRAGERGYGWTKWFVHKLHLKLSKPIKVASYIPLPKEVADTKAVLNIQNADDKCCMWCVLVHLHKVNKNPERIKQYQEYMSELHFKGLKFPIQLEAIDQFEEQNRPITLNVYE